MIKLSSLKQIHLPLNTIFVEDRKKINKYQFNSRKFVLQIKHHKLANFDIFKLNFTRKIETKNSKLKKKKLINWVNLIYFSNFINNNF